MDLATLFKTSRRRKIHFNKGKFIGIKNKFIFNTLTPKFEYKNSKGDLVTFKKGALL